MIDLDSLEIHTGYVQHVFSEGPAAWTHFQQTVERLRTKRFHDPSAYVFIFQEMLA